MEYTKECLNDLLNQDIVFNLRLIDQNSSEFGTKEFFDEFFSDWDEIKTTIMVMKAYQVIDHKMKQLEFEKKKLCTTSIKLNVQVPTTHSRIL